MKEDLWLSMIIYSVIYLLFTFKQRLIFHCWYDVRTMESIATAKKITAVHCARAILILHTVISSTSCLITVYFQMEAHSSPLSDV